MRAKSIKLPAIKASQWPADQVERRKVERLVTPRTAPDWGKKARELTGQGVDLVVEVGGVGTLNESIRAIRIGGTIAFIGVLAGPPPAELRLPLMVMQQQRLQGVTVGSVEDLQAMCDAIAVNKMKPVIDKTLPFDQAAEAFRYMASVAHFGKVAIDRMTERTGRRRDIACPRMKRPLPSS